MDILNKTHFAVRFYFVVADQIARRIVWLNDGYWPRTVHQWRQIAHKIEFDLLELRDAPYIPACCLFRERTILIQRLSCPKAFHRSIAHEIAHALIYVGGPVDDLLEWPREPEDCHIVARLVEEWVDA